MLGGGSKGRPTPHVHMPGGAPPHPAAPSPPLTARWGLVGGTHPVGARSLGLALLLLPAGHHPPCPHCAIAPLPCLAPQRPFALPSRGERQLCGSLSLGPPLPTPPPQPHLCWQDDSLRGTPNTLQVGLRCPATRCPPMGAAPRLWAPAPDHPAQADTLRSLRGRPG